MLPELIKDMNRALDANCYLAALAIALMLPDICSRAEYPENKSVSYRYKTWYENNISHTAVDGVQIFPYLSGEVIYSLRNMFLHQGTPNIEKDKISQEENKIDHFMLSYSLENKSVNTASYTTLFYGEKEVKICRINICYLCSYIGNAAEHYYNNNKEKFDFFNYFLIDEDKELAEKENTIRS